MRKINLRKVGFAFLLMTIALMVFNMVPGAALASLGVGSDDLPSALSGTSGDLKQVIKSIINTVLGLLGFIAVIFIIYAGILYVTDGGGGDNLEKAKNIIKNAIIGIVIIIASFAIVNFAFNITDGSGSTTSSSSVITQ
jgi:type IV secretory pathway VirB2 component (pilin)